jgi:UDP-hydrolysing UDP-N-acetyl-D-glucosamine 2-epimerase
MATAVAAAYMNIPLAHIQGGEVTGSVDEKVRHAVTKLADLHLVSTEKSAERVIRMGEEPEKVFVTGCPSIDIAARVLADPGQEIDPFVKFGGVGAKVDLCEGYLVVMQHPVTTEYEKSRRQVTETLYAIKALGLPTLWFWPNVDAGSDGVSKGIRSFREIEQPANIHFFKDIPPFDFLRILHRSRGIIGNSSVAIRECSYLGVPAVNIGTRELGRDRGPNVIDVDYDRDQIAQAVRTHLSNGRPPRVTLYGDGHAGQRIAQVLAEAPLNIHKRLTY